GLSAADDSVSDDCVACSSSSGAVSFDPVACGLGKDPVEVNFVGSG
ncbi:hypothetical protein A2U01_0082602, partial [Trifolium medium]|nr:hypothetical protein [Trifolium medium]